MSLIERKRKAIPLSAEIGATASGLEMSGGVGLAAVMRDEWVPQVQQLEGAVEERDELLKTLGLLGWLYAEATGHAATPDDYMRAARAMTGGQ